jgi:hypothetical protein
MKPLLHLLLGNRRPRLVITAEFRQAFEAMERTNDCLYVTGRAGTGKSTLLAWFRRQTQKRLVVLAPTGIAALNVDGQTIHSFFRFPPQVIESPAIRFDPERATIYRQLDAIVIDEISMVRADVMDAIDYSLRLHRGDNAPFGGVQMILFGDLYQLLPAVTRELTGYFFERFGGHCFFHARVFAATRLTCISLQTIFRQKDETFKQLLNAVRENQLTDDQLALLNTRYLPDDRPAPGDLRLTLTTTNKVADVINAQRMKSLPGRVHSFDAVMEGCEDPGCLPTDVSLQLKKGAQVMLLRNDADKRWVNGTLGRVTRLSTGAVTVRIGRHSYEIEPATWEIREYRYDPRKKKIEPGIAGTFTQFPLRPAWAMTIHKSQGRTFDQVIIHLGAGAFTHGQVYVALSRCTSLAGVVLKTPLRREDLILDPGVRQFIADHARPAA